MKRGTKIALIIIFVTLGVAIIFVATIGFVFGPPLAELFTAIYESESDDDSRILDDLALVFEMEPEDCFPGESYDSVDKLCYIDCDSPEECDRKEQEILARLDEIGGDFIGGENSFRDASQTETTIAVYNVSGDSLTILSTPDVPDDLLDEQGADARHAEMWHRFTRLVPDEAREDIIQYEVFTDGLDGSLAAVYQDEEDPSKWILAVDIQDAYRDDVFDKGGDFTYSIVHEFAHLLTLNDVQIDMNNFRETNCATFFTPEGCSQEGSYIDAFFDRFWTDRFEDILEIEQIPEDDAYLDALDELYLANQDEFVTDYAVTNPGEDIAESWTLFVLKPHPTDDTIASQKVRFFEQYTELRRLRDFIRQRI